MEISIYFLDMAVDDPDFICVDPVTRVLVLELTLVKHSVLDLEDSVRFPLPLQLVLWVSGEIVPHLVSIHYFV